jgi:hypothetical protein
VCGGGKVSNATGATSIVTCVNCPVGYYWGSTVLGGANCIICPVGSFCSAPGTTIPSNCPAGTFTNTPGTTTCTNCPPGTFSLQIYANTFCTPCAAGTYLPTPQGTAQSNCLSCTAPGIFCPAGAVSNTVPCPAGWACPGGGLAPVPAPAGSFSAQLNYTNSSYFPLCAPGSYSAAPGSAACTPCPAGTAAISAAPGQNSSSNCAVCPAGTSSFAGALTCSPCARGTAAPNAGTAGNCTACLPGLYQGSTGQTSCVACPAGSTSTVVGATSASSCLGCPLGQYIEGYFVGSTGLCSLVSASAAAFFPAPLFGPARRPARPNSPTH